MSWIREVEESEAEGELKEIYQEIITSRGKLSNIMKVHSLNPEAMKAHMDLYMSIMFKSSTIKRPQCEMIAVVVSAANGCSYCINHHAEALNHYWRDDKRVERLIQEPESVDLGEKEGAMVDYARKLTSSPDATTEDDIENLRDAGLTDKDILNVNLIVSYFNFVNRIALGLGVEFGAEEIKGYDY
ncbi:MAG: peroxidase-related enzyme [Thermoplasmata archaeon]